MADVRNQESSGAASQCSYDVFLSFRGEDTRKSFTDHLYTALVDAEFRTFRDDEEINLGETIKSELQKAILQSRVSIIIFSKDYASSGWCLQELVMILNHMRTSEHVVIPVFYDIGPSDIRNQTGSIAEAFSNHEKQFNAEMDERKKNELMDKVNEWKAALREVADIGQRFLQNQPDGHDSKFIEKIVAAVSFELNCPRALGVDPYQFEMDDCSDGHIMLICGMGGIGKTTIAKFVYNLNFEKFEACSFLANIRECSERSSGLVGLQRKLLSDIQKNKKSMIHVVEEGKIRIKHAISRKKVLIVLDDVDHKYQLEALLGMQDWYYPGSKIIITTRQKQLLKGYEVSKVQEVEKLDGNESLELFSWHAFGQDHPLEGYEDYSKRLVEQCGGLPLALITIAATLSGRSLAVFESAVEKMKAIPNSEVLASLRMSFDCLDEHDKHLFLNIACFFIGKDKDYVTTLLDGCDFYTKVGIENLMDRYLLTVDQDNKLMMHQLLQDMGRELVRQESPKKPGKRSRLWRHEDALDVLQDTTGTERIEGLVLDFHVTEDSMRYHSENSSKRRHTSLLSWLPIVSSTVKSPSTTDKIIIETAAFSRMPRLRLLQLNNVQFTGGYNKFPSGLRWLCWHRFPLRSFPEDLPMKHLVALDMQYSSLKQVWKGPKLLSRLKILDLSHSHDLTNSPDFSGLPNLERLMLKDCINLFEVHKSVVTLERLILLNLEGCINLRNLPSKFDHLKSLEKLVLSGCSKLDKLPPELEEMGSLTVLYPDLTAINELPCTTGKQKYGLSLVIKIQIISIFLFSVFYFYAGW
ncbi:hypothetical protein LguiB_006542 [Lonicera macranthoides]